MSPDPAAPPSGNVPAPGESVTRGPSPFVMLRPLGSPLTVGMSGLAIASLVQTGVELHWTAAAQRPQAGLILITVPFLLQMLACIFSYLVHDGATGAAVGVRSTSWLATGLVDLSSPLGTRSGPLGLLLLDSGAVVLLTAIAISTEKVLPGFVFTTAAARFLLAGVHELTGAAGWQLAAGWCGLLVCGLAGYAAFAFELDRQRERPVLPTLRRERAARQLREPSIDPGPARPRARSAGECVVLAVPRRRSVDRVALRVVTQP